MATEQEQQQLIDTLKFTPRTYRIELRGYGGEIVVGKISREAYDWFTDNEIDPNDYAWGDADDYEDIPEGLFYPGEWHECDNLAHAWGVEFSEENLLTVYDENQNEIYEKPLSYELEEDGVELSFGAHDEIYASNYEGECVYVGQSFEKGQFFAADIALTQPFDPSKLSIEYEDIDGWTIVSSVSYNGEELTNDGGDTIGKGSNSYVTCNVDEEVDDEVDEGYNEVDED